MKKRIWGLLKTFLAVLVVSVGLALTDPLAGRFPNFHIIVVWVSILFFGPLIQKWSDPPEE